MKKYIVVTIIISFILLFSACKDWLDINNDPNVASDIKINLILPSVQYDIATDLSLGSHNIGYVCGVYVHQLSTREEYDQYGINGGSYANTSYWSDLYSGPAKELDVLIKKGEDQDNLIYAGIGKIMKAYLFSQIVDIWGDVPYTEYGQKGNYSPKFDSDKDIYKKLFLLIDQGIADIENSDSKNIIKPGGDDLIYGGDTEKWMRFANTLKLKLYVQVQKTDLWDATKVQALITENKLIEQDSEFLFPFGTSVSPDNRHNGFSSEYGGSQIGTYISPWFFKIMMGMNDKIFTGNRDPRIAYYWCRQARLENTPEYAWKDTDGKRFISIYFGSTGVNRDAGGRATFTMPGIYPVGGKFDDATPPLSSNGLGIDDGTGASPMRLLTYADRKYLEAELYKIGLISGDARATLLEAINASFALVDKVVDMNGSSQTIPTLSGSSDVTNYINSVMTEYDAANSEKQFEIIMTQKWIQRFGGSAVDSYTDYRRTAYPVLFNPAVDASDGGNYLAEDVPTQISRGYVVSWPYPQDELDVNVNAPAQKNQTTDKLFWDVD